MTTKARAAARHPERHAERADPLYLWAYCARGEWRATAERITDLFRQQIGREPRITWNYYPEPERVAAVFAVLQLAVPAEAQRADEHASIVKAVAQSGGFVILATCQP